MAGVFVSTYENNTTRVPPKSLKATSRWKRKVDGNTDLLKSGAAEPEVRSATGLGKKLQDLEERLGPQQQEQQKPVWRRRRMSFFNSFRNQKKNF